MQEVTQEPKLNMKIKMKRILLVINCILMSIGGCSGPIFLRLYFLHGGNRVWFSSFQETAGFPVIVIPLVVSYVHRIRKHHASTRTTSTSSRSTKIIYMSMPVFLASACIGVLTGLDDFLYANGVARIPVSTASLIIASQLVFTALFAYLLVKQKFTFLSFNAVVLLSMGSGVLALHTSSDRPKHESNSEYIKGFLMTLGASMLYGFVLPSVELIYKKAKQRVTYTLVLEIQFVICMFATLFCIVGMIINNDFKAIPREASQYGLGEVKYYVVVWCCTVAWQCFFLGTIGVIFCASSLFSGIVIAVLLPVTEILAVIVFKESFQAEKGVSLALSLWGFISYFYGEMQQVKQNRRDAQLLAEAELP